MFQQGPQQSIHIHLVGERTLQVSVFDSTIKPGLIQVLTKELASKLACCWKQIADRSEDEGEKAPDLKQASATRCKTSSTICLEICMAIKSKQLPAVHPPQQVVNLRLVLATP